MVSMKAEEVKIFGKRYLKGNNIDEREARLLLAFVLQISLADLFKINEITEEQFKLYKETLEKRVSGIPFSYITGEKEFMKLMFKVNENVLIPRPETELLVEEALKYNVKNVLDMCTGSGCIAVSVAFYNKKANVTAVDISQDALKIAQENATKNGVNVKFVCSDLFTNITEKYDIIISNPPYIETKTIDNLDLEVRKEPHIALDGGIDGLYFYRNICENAHKYLNENGVLMFEIGYNQGTTVSEILKNNFYKNIRIVKDLSGNDRICIGNI